VLKPPPPGADVVAVRPTSDDRGDIVLGWLTRLTVTLGVLGLLGFDALSLAVARLQVEDHANDAAGAAAGAWATSKDVQGAYDAAVHALVDDGAGADTIDPHSFSVALDGRVTLTVQHVATTLLVSKVGATRHWADSQATVSAAAPR
jgi:hypothetical protein